MRTRSLRCCFIAVLLVSFSVAAAETMPKLVHQNGQFTLLVDGKPYLLLGAQVHNSSGWPGNMAMLWPTLLQLHANTIMVPVYWQAVEPEPGHFDFSMVDAIVQQRAS